MRGGRPSALLASPLCPSLAPPLAPKPAPGSAAPGGPARPSPLQQEATARMRMGRFRQTHSSIARALRGSAPAVLRRHVKCKHQGGMTRQKCSRLPGATPLIRSHRPPRTPQLLQQRLLLLRLPLHGRQPLPHLRQRRIHVANVLVGQQQAVQRAAGMGGLGGFGLGGQTSGSGGQGAARQGQVSIVGTRNRRKAGHWRAQRSTGREPHRAEGP